MGLSRLFGKYSPYRAGAMRGAAIGGIGGAAWGMASDDTSVLGGAAIGAGLGAIAGGGLAARRVQQRALRQSLLRDMGMMRPKAFGAPLVKSNAAAGGSKVGSTLKSVSAAPVVAPVRSGVSVTVGRGASAAEFEAETAARSQFAALDFSKGGRGAGRAGVGAAQNLPNAEAILRAMKPSGFGPGIGDPLAGLRKNLAAISGPSWTPGGARIFNRQASAAQPNPAAPRVRLGRP